MRERNYLRFQAPTVIDLAFSAYGTKSFQFLSSVVDNSCSRSEKIMQTRQILVIITSCNILHVQYCWFEVLRTVFTPEGAIPQVLSSLVSSGSDSKRPSQFIPADIALVFFNKTAVQSAS